MSSGSWQSLRDDCYERKSNSSNSSWQSIGDDCYERKGPCDRRERKLRRERMRSRKFPRWLPKTDYRRRQPCPGTQTTINLKNPPLKDILVMRHLEGKGLAPMDIAKTGKVSLSSILGHLQDAPVMERAATPRPFKRNEWFCGGGKRKRRSKRKKKRTKAIRRNKTLQRSLSRKKKRGGRPKKYRSKKKKIQVGLE
tara:strand:+ start:2830 stop:3417 length:588 start_codon:yes stop_codon:yes gene_type:complete